MEAIVGVEYSYDKNGTLIVDSKGRIGVKSIHHFLNFKFAKDWLKKSAFDMAGDDGDTIIDLDGKRGTCLR